MIPMRISNATRILAENQDEYHALAIHDHQDAQGNNVMISLWEPTPAEIEHIKAGGHIRLGILGRIHPPVHITTQAPPAVEEGET
jgi:hypothetical protein